MPASKFLRVALPLAFALVALALALGVIRDGGDPISWGALVVAVVGLAISIVFLKPANARGGNAVHED